MQWAIDAVILGPGSEQHSLPAYCLFGLSGMGYMEAQDDYMRRRRDNNALPVQTNAGFHAGLLSLLG
jgi:hypothetical protein